MGRGLDSFWHKLYKFPPVGNLAITLGWVKGQRPLGNKYGRNTEIDAAGPADIWDNGHVGQTLTWIAPTEARTHTIASTNVGDTFDGAGLRTLRIYGLTGWDKRETSEVITMNTGSPPVTTKSYVIIHRMRALTWGDTDVNIGTITATAADDGTVTAQINAGQGETLMAIYGVPSIQTACLYGFYANMNRGSGGAATGYIDIVLLGNPRPDADTLRFITEHTLGLSLTGTSAIYHNYPEPKKFPGPVIIKIKGIAKTDNLDVSAGFCGTVIDNEFVKN